MKKSSTPPCRPLAILAASIALVCTATAQVTWDATSALDTNWSNPLNWNPDAEPLATDAVVFPTPIPNPGALPTPGTLTLSPGEIASSLDFADSYMLTGGSLTLASGAINIGGTAIATIASPVLGSNGLTKSGTGTLTFGSGDVAANLYTGVTSIGAGDVRLNKAAGIDALPGNISLTGGRLLWQADNQIPNSATITNDGGQIYFANQTASNGYSETFASVTQTTGNFRTHGPGSQGPTAPQTTITITGAASFSGGQFSVDPGGTVSVDSLTLLPGAGAAYNLTGNHTVAVTTLNIGAGGLTLEGTTLGINSGTTTGAQGARVNLNGNITTNASNTEAVISRNANTIGLSRLNLAAGMRTITTADGGAVIDLRIARQIEGPGGITKEGAGLLSLTAGPDTATDDPSNFTGDVTVNGGILSFYSNSAGNALGAGAKAITIANNATLRVNSQTVGGVVSTDFNPAATNAGTPGKRLVIGVGGGTLETLHNVTLDDGNNGSTGLPQLSGTGTLTKRGALALNLGRSDGTSSDFSGFLGQINIEEGTVVATGAGSPLGAITAGTVVSSGASLRINPGTSGFDEIEPLTIAGNGVSNAGALTTSSTGAVAFPGPITLSAAAAIGSTAALNPANLFTISGTISGTAALSKVGAGTVLITGNNTATFTGDFNLNTGVVALVGNGALGGISALTVATGTILALDFPGLLNRVSNTAPVTLGGTILLGDGAREGTSFTDGLGALTLSGSSTLDFGTTGASASALTFDSFAPAGFTLTIQNWNGTPGVAGVDGVNDRLIFNADQSANLAFFDFVGTGAQQFDLGGGYFEIVAVPEPSAALAAIFAGGLLLVRRRRR